MREREMPRDEKMSIKRLGILSATAITIPLDTSNAIPTKMVA
jgi:hypothetical protein